MVRNFYIIAEEYYYKALFHLPQNELGRDIYNNLASFYYYSGEAQKALLCYKEAETLEPGEQTKSFVVDISRSTGSFKDWNYICHEMKELVKNAKQGSSLTPYNLLFYPLPRDGLRKVIEYVSTREVTFAREYKLDANRILRNINPKNRVYKPVRVGYFSRDFTEEHPMCLLTCGMIENHHTQYVEDLIFNYNTNIVSSECEIRVRETAFEYQYIYIFINIFI